jgi:hypothetical protein
MGLSLHLTQYLLASLYIVRNMATHSQDTVKIDALSDYIKHLK